MCLICGQRYRYVFDMRAKTSICIWYAGRDIDMYLIYATRYRYVFDIPIGISISVWYIDRDIDMYLIYGPKYRYIFDIRADISICIWYTGRYIDVDFVSRVGRIGRYPTGRIQIWSSNHRVTWHLVAGQRVLNFQNSNWLIVSRHFRAGIIPNH